MRTIGRFIIMEEDFSVFLRKIFHKYGKEDVMKFSKRWGAVLLAVLAVLPAGGCGGNPDAGLLFREAKANSAQIKSCGAAMESTLVFDVDGKKHTSLFSNQIQYTANPFALKSVQTSQNDGPPSKTTGYTVTQDGKLWFYCENGSGWQKSAVPNMDTTPGAQVDILRLTGYATGEKYVRREDLNSRQVHKLELTMSSEVLRSMVESIVAASGMGNGSKTIVQTLLDSAQPVYAYAYVDAQSGQFARLECDMSDALDAVFQNIDGNTVKVHVEKASISGSVTGIGASAAFSLPAGAAAASSVEASG